MLIHCHDESSWGVIEKGKKWLIRVTRACLCVLCVCVCWIMTCICSIDCVLHPRSFFSIFLFLFYKFDPSSDIRQSPSRFVIWFGLVLFLDLNPTWTHRHVNGYHRYPLLPTQPGPGHFLSLRGGWIGHYETSTAKSFQRQIGERKVKTNGTAKTTQTLKLHNTYP